MAISVLESLENDTVVHAKEAKRLLEVVSDSFLNGMFSTCLVRQSDRYFKLNSVLGFICPIMFPLNSS